MKKVFVFLTAAAVCLTALPPAALAVEEAPPSSYSAHDYTISVTQLGGPHGYVGPNGEYYSNRYVSEGMVSISPREGGSTGFCDLQGNVVIEPKYSYTGIRFHDGRCPVGVLDEWTGIMKYGYLDKSGNIAIEAVYDYVGDFINGVARVGTDGKELCIDTSGTVLGEIRYEWGVGDTIVDSDGTVLPFLFPAEVSSFSRSYHEGLKVANAGSKYGAIDESSNVVIPYRYDFLTDFSNGLAVAQIGAGNDGVGVIDTKGNVVVPFDWSYVTEPFNKEGVVILVWPGNGNQYVLEIEQGQNGGSGAAEKPSAWAAEPVNAAIAAGLVSQALQTQYTQAATRAEFCALATALYETAKGTVITQRTAFTDTDDVNVEKMAALGVVSGVGGGRFDPEGKLTREQAAAMLSRLADALGKPLPAGAPTFSDKASISAWAVDAVGRVQAAGIMSGVGGNSFAPQGEYTREQSILTMYRLYELLG